MSKILSNLIVNFIAKKTKKISFNNICTYIPIILNGQETLITVKIDRLEIELGKAEEK